MRNVTFAALGLLFWAATGNAQTLPAGASADRTPADRAIERRAVEAVIWGMPAVNYDLMLQEMLTKTAGKVNQIIYWGASARLAKPDADAQSRRALLHGVLQHQGAGPIVIEMPPADGDGSLNAQHRHCLADAAGGRRPARRRQGRGRQVPDPAAGLRGDSARRLHRAAVRTPSAATRCCARTSRATATPTSPSRSPTASGSRSIRCRRRPIRRRRCSPTSKDVLFDSTIRYDASFFTIARPHRAERAVARRATAR